MLNLKGFQGHRILEVIQDSKEAKNKLNKEILKYCKNKKNQDTQKKRQSYTMRDKR
jgi:predicted lipoprotein